MPEEPPNRLRNREQTARMVAAAEHELPAGLTGPLECVTIIVTALGPGDRSFSYSLAGSEEASGFLFGSERPD